MAACADAAARSSRTYSCVFVLLTGLSLLSHALSRRLRYEQVELLKIGNRCQDYTIGNPNSIPWRSCNLKGSAVAVRSSPHQ